MVACRYYNNKNRTPMNYKTNNSCELQINQNVTLIKQHKASINILNNIYKFTTMNHKDNYIVSQSSTNETGANMKTNTHTHT